jgi:hypothetical protein
MSNTTSNILDAVKAARRVSVPIVAITTPDPAATIKAIVGLAAGNGTSGEASPSPATGAMLQWDLVEGVRSLNDAGKTVRAAIIPGDQDPTVFNPVNALTLAKQLPPKSVLFMHLANRFINEPGTIQAVWNLRDVFKQDQRMLVLLAIACDWPAELSGDIVVLDEPLPDADALREIIVRCHSAAELPLGKDYESTVLPRGVEAVQGLPAFQAEQVVAMSLTRKGMDVPALWERKRLQIELTPGLKVQREAAGESNRFSDIGGVQVVKDFLGRIMAGQSRPNAVVFVDEIEKFLAGASGGAADSSGVSQDQLGQLLSYMQDHGAAGCIFVGPPGAAKSAVAKAAGNEAGIPTIQLDLGAMKGSLVGSSEQNLRHALKVITSVSNGRSLWIATCNSIGDLPPELRRRFTLGTFFFDLPDAMERHQIWRIWTTRYGFPVESNHLSSGGDADRFLFPDDAGWTGAEIRQCCDIAWRLSCSLQEAAAFVVPVSRSAAEQLERLRKAAEGRFLSASKPGVYAREQGQKPTNDRRRMELED